jgi:hypothetical protein
MDYRDGFENLQAKQVHKIRKVDSVSLASEDFYLIKMVLEKERV